ncbi:MAG: hypothetical protein ACR2KJ_13360 [Jatrophihabitans sp.]
MAWWMISLGIPAIGALLVAGRSWTTRRIQTNVLTATGPEPALVAFTKVYIPGTVTWDGQRATVRSPAPAPALNGAGFAVSRMSAAQHQAGARVLNKVMKLSAHLPGASRSTRR